jgi:hypothetical protein
MVIDWNEERTMFDQEDDACSCEQCTAAEPAGSAVNAAQATAADPEAH